MRNRRQQPDRGRARPSKSPSVSDAFVSGVAIRHSFRALGLVLAVQPWLAWPWGGTVDPFGASRWLAGIAGVLLCLALLWREIRSSGASGGLSARDPRVLGALLILGGLIVGALASPATLLGLRVTAREGTLVLFALSLALAPPPRAAETRWLIGCLLFSMSLHAALALAQLAAPGAVQILLPGWVSARGGRSAVVGAFGNPEYLAAWLACGLAASIVLILRTPPDVRGRDRWLPPIAAAMTLAVIFLSGGRGAFASVVGALAAWWILRGRRVPALASAFARRRTLILAAATLGMLAVLTLGVSLNPRLRRFALPARLATLTDLQSASVRHRIGLAVVSGRMILADPILGCGPGRFGVAFHDTLGRLLADDPDDRYRALADALSGSYVGEAHCDVQQWWAEYGLAPLAGLALLLATALGAPPRTPSTAADTAANPAPIPAPNPAIEPLWTALAALAINLWISFPLHEPARAVLWWSLIGVLAASSRAIPRKGPVP
jgi:hypothetical protein